MAKKQKIRMYCPKCGRECVIGRQLVYYNTESGKPLYRYWANCPINIKMKWWQRLFSGHAHNIYAGGEFLPRDEILDAQDEMIEREEEKWCLDRDDDDPNIDEGNPYYWDDNRF